ncbi:stage III sporulation protein AG [Virgibacillus sp. W0181]|uniref:stage III sporulation protein AG n=1 Tax=Virgibacillus sp. W0181 TaxID=3391581 RepID=UPI003F46E1CE
MKDKLKKLLQKVIPVHKENGTSKKTNYLIIIALIGILLIIISNTFATLSKDPENDQEEIQIKESDKNRNTEAVETSVMNEVDNLETSFENELKEMLEKIEGVSGVEVMVNLDSTNVKVYEKNLILGQQKTNESDQNGGIRKVEDSTEESQVVLIRQGDQEVPILIHTKKPDVRGVFIVAKGADHATTKKWIVESTARVLDVPTHRVSVMPKN